MIDYLRVREELQTSVDFHQTRFLIRVMVVIKRRSIIELYPSIKLKRRHKHTIIQAAQTASL
jgi:hypothetical protein